MLRFDVGQPNELNADIIGQAKYKDIPADDEGKIPGAKNLIKAKHDKSTLL